MSKLLSADDILGADDRPSEVVDVPEWGGSVRVRVMTGRQRDQYVSQMIDRSGDKPKPNVVDLRAKLVALCIVDDKGEQLFTGKQIEELSHKSTIVLDRLYDAAVRINCLAPGAVGDAEKNSASGQTADSTSA